MNNEKKRRIVIVNAHWSNRGDEAALRALIDALIEAGHCNIQVIFKDDKPVRQFPYQKNVTHFSAKFLPKSIWQEIIAVCTKGNPRVVQDDALRRTVRAVKKADFLIYAPGGAVICRRFWWRKQLEYLLPFLCAKIFRIPMVVAAPSIGPFDHSIYKKTVVRCLLKVPKMICVREDISKAYLAELGIRKHVVTTADMAFYNREVLKENDKVLGKQNGLESFFHTYEKVIGLTISDFSWHVKYSSDAGLSNKIEHIMKGFIGRMKTEGIGVILIPQLFGNQNDKRYLGRFQDSNTFLLSDDLDAYFQQCLISRLYAVVGMRYHSNIFAAKAGVPFLAIAYEEKMQGFMEMHRGLEQYLILLEDLSLESLWEKWKNLENNYGRYQKDLKVYKKKWQKQAEKTLHLIETEI